MKRREFIQVTGLAVAGTCLFFSACKTAEIPVINGEIRVPLTEFKKKDFLVITSSDKQRIVITKKNNAYKALSMLCTHKGIGLNVSDHQLVCPAHGSIFDFDGNVKSSPAKLPLKSFPVKMNESELIIQIA